MTGSIPRVLHQTVKDKSSIPAVWQECRATWSKHLLDGWEMRLWDDEDNERFMQENYPQYLQLYRDLPRPINRVDMIRNLYLHRFGGFYADADTKCLKPIDDLCAMPGVPVILGTHASIGGSFIECAFMGSAPGHPLWLEVVEAIKQAHYRPTVVQMLAKRVPSLAVLCTTGPFLLTQVVRRAMRSHPDWGIRVFPSEYFYPDPRVLPYPESAYTVHMFTGTWVPENGWEHRLFEFQQGRFARTWLLVLVSVVALTLFACIVWAAKRAYTAYTTHSAHVAHVAHGANHTNPSSSPQKLFMLF